jgi:hypothetical protein
METQKAGAASGKGLVLRDAAVCLSLANLCFLKTLSSYQSNYRELRILMRRLPGPAQYLSIVMDIVLLAGLLFGCVSWARRRSSVWINRALLLGYLILLEIILNGLRVALAGSGVEIGDRAWVTVGVAVNLLYVAAMWRWMGLTLRMTRVVLVCLFPFCLMTLGQSLWKAVAYDSRALQDSPLAPMLAHARTTPRVVWIIFDAWDYHLTFVDRPAKLQMPAVDRFRSEFLSATDAYAPAADTIHSMPDLITGRILTNPRVSQSVETVEQHALYVAGIPLGSLPSIFSAAHQRGYNISVAGWYIPYGRWFPGVLADCAWWSLPSEFNSTGITFLQSAFLKPISLVEVGPYSLFGQSLTAKRKTQIYLEFMRHSRDALANPAIGFLFLHVPFPHPVHTYNRFTGRFDANTGSVEGYTNSLALTDRTLSELREEMERDGTWEGAAVVLSGDHPNIFAPGYSAKSDQRVPFLLKLPGEQQPTVFPNRFNTIVTADLLLNVLDGRITNVAEASAWLEQHRNDAQEPVPAQVLP